MTQEKHLYDWASTEAHWLEEYSSISSEISDVPELSHWDDDKQLLADQLPLAIEPIVTGAATGQQEHDSLIGSEMHRNWLHAGAIGLTVLTALGSVGVFSGKGVQKYINPTNTATAERHGILPPADPPANIVPSPNFSADCRSTRYDNSTDCVQTTLKAINNARAQEGVPAMQLPSNWYTLTPSKQLFLATNLERSVRGLHTFSAMSTALDQAASRGANEATDPSPPTDFPFSEWAANWAGAVGNSLEAIYYWMYDDGRGSGNIDCTTTATSGCWDHRNNILMHLPCQPCLMGAAMAPTAFRGDPSMAEILVGNSRQ